MAPSSITCNPARVASRASRIAPLTLQSRLRSMAGARGAARPALGAVLTACTARLLGGTESSPGRLHRLLGGDRDADPAGLPQALGERELARGHEEGDGEV